MMRVFRTVSMLALVLSVSTRVNAAVTYQIDNNDFSAGSMNVSDGTETRDNWIGNIFTIQAGAEKITHVLFRSGPDAWPVTVGIYKDNGDATPPKAATLIYQQNFNSAKDTLNDFVLTTPPVLAAGDKMVVGIFAASVPGDKYPYAVSKDTTLGRSYWDRNFSIANGDGADIALSLNDLSKAVATNQLVSPNAWLPSQYDCNTAGIRALGEVVPEPATVGLLVLGGLLLRRRR